MSSERSRSVLQRVAHWGLGIPRLARLLVPVAIMAMLWHASSREPVVTGGGVLRGLAYNGLHVVAYAVLATAWILALTRQEMLGVAAAGRRCARIACLLAIAYGIADEVHQSFVPGRTASFGDVFSDVCGAALAGLLVRRFLYDDASALRWLPWLLAVACGSVAIATLFAI